MVYPIVETFYSIQGEGFWTGSPAFFIRFAGCNLSCPWCDTDHEQRSILTLEKLVAMAVNCHAPRVILTGGEPLLLPLPHLFALVTSLKESGKWIAVETNGTKLLGGHIQLFDWITVSPKTGVEYDLPAVWGDELKIVLDGKIDPHIFDSCSFKHRFIQPCSGDFISAVQWVKENPTWRLSVQTHKLIGIA